MIPKVTVIVPVYNAEKHLNNAVDSIISQTFGFENIELILVDDKSTDGSGDIIRDYQNKYDNIKGIFLEKNTGFPGGPRNVGIDNATAPYLVFMDNDDYYLPEAIELYYSTMEKEGCDFLMSSHYHGNGEKLTKINYINTDERIVNLNPLESQRNFDVLSVNHVAPWSKMWRKDFIIKNDIRFLDDCLCEDTFFYFKALINAGKVTVLPNDVCYVYNIFDDSTIHNHSKKMFDNYFEGIKRTVDVLMDVELSKRVMLNENISGVLLVFSNLSKEDKKVAIKEIYDFETNLDHEIVFNRKEIGFLNNLILNRHFFLASKVAGFYRFLYNNKFIFSHYRLRINIINNNKVD